eukprot:s1042_g1.t1
MGGQPSSNRWNFSHGSHVLYLQFHSCELITGNCRDLASLFGHFCLVRLLPFDQLMATGSTKMEPFLESRSL